MNSDYSDIKKLMLEGQFVLAERSIQILRKRNPSHIGLLCDQAVCAYQIGHFFDSKNYLNEAILALNKTENELPFPHRARSHICIAKLLEEFGYIRKAFNIYENCIDKWGNEAVNATPSEFLEIKQMLSLVYANYLRISSTHTLPIPDFFSIYQQLKGQIEIDPEHLCFDIEHALFIAEVSNFGWEAGEVRLKKILNSDCVGSQDRKLVLFDALEYFLNIKNTEHVPDYLKSALVKAPSLNLYEKVLKDIALATPRAEEECFLKVLQNQDSAATLLRLGRIVTNIGFSQERQIELKRIMGKILESLPTEERKIWARHYSGNASNNSNTIVNLILTDKGISLGTRFIPLDKRPITKRLLDFLATHDSKATTDSILTEYLYETTKTGSGVKRLRTLIARTNQILLPVTALEKTIHYSGTSIRLDAEVKIIRKP